jgi:hypothetical protein
MQVKRAAPIDDVLLSAGNVNFGNAFANSDPTLPGDLDWNLAANGTTTHRARGPVSR